MQMALASPCTSFHRVSIPTIIKQRRLNIALRYHSMSSYALGIHDRLRCSPIASLENLKECLPRASLGQTTACSFMSAEEMHLKVAEAACKFQVVSAPLAEYELQIDDRQSLPRADIEVKLRLHR